MKAIARYLFPALLSAPMLGHAVQPRKAEQVTETKNHSASMPQFFIDKFFVLAAAIETFKARTKINRDLIKTIPGFIEDHIYESIDEQGNLTCVTVATWSSAEALSKAKEVVQAEYKKEGFNPAAMLQELHITMERGIFRETE